MTITQKLFALTFAAATAFALSACAGSDPTKEMFHEETGTTGSGLSCGQKLDNFMRNCSTYYGATGSCSTGGGSLSCSCAGSSFSTSCPQT